MIHRITCKKCERFLGEATQSMTANIKCSNSKCKEMNEVKIVFMSDVIKNHGVKK